MRRILLVILLFLSLSCRVFSPQTPASLLLPTIEGYSPDPATLQAPLVLETLQTGKKSDTSQLSPSDFSVAYHPDGRLYAGDQVSLEVIAPDEYDLAGYSVELEAPGINGGQTSSVGFGRYG